MNAFSTPFQPSHSLLKHRNQIKCCPTPTRSPFLRKRGRASLITSSALREQHSSSYSTLSDELNQLIRTNNYRLALHRLETTILEQTDPRQPIASYKYFHELITYANNTRKWHMALRSFQALEATGYTSARSTSALVLSVLSRAGRVNEAQQLLETLWQSHLRQCDGTDRVLTDIERTRRLPDEKMVTQTANAAVQNGRPELALSLLKQMNEHDILPTIFSVSVQIKAYGRQGRPDSILNLLSSLNRLDVYPDIVVYNTAIDAFIRCNDFSSAMQVLSEIERRGLEQTVRSYNPIIKHLASQGRLDQAFALRKTMEDKGIRATPYTINALLFGCTKTKQWDIAKDLLLESHSMDDETPTSSLNHIEPRTKSHQGLSKNIIVGYTTVISGLATNNKMPAALLLLENIAEKVEAAGKPPELETELGIAITAIMSAFLRKGDVVRAWMLLRSAQRRFSIKLPPDTYTAVIRGLTRRGDDISFDAANRVFMEMLHIFRDRKRERGEKNRNRRTERDLPVVEATPRDFELAYNSMIDCLVKRGNTIAAEGLLDEMEDNGHNPTTVTFTTLINGYGKEMDLISAKRTFKRMRDIGLTPDRIALNAFLGACIRTRDMTLAMKIFEHMQSKGPHLSPNLVTFSAMISGFLRENKKKEAWDAYEEMKGLGIAPNERLLERMMAAFVSIEIKPKKEEVWLLDDEEFEYEEKMDMQNLLKETKSIEEKEGLDDNETIMIVKEEVEDESMLIVEDDENVEENELVEIDEELKKSLLSIGGWDSERALTLLHDMSHCKVSEINRRRWRKAIKDLYGSN